MTAITFDTLNFVEQLTAAGVPEAHAKAQACAFRGILSEAIDTTVATKSDIRELKADIFRLESNMEKMEMRMTIKLGAFIAAAVGILIAVLRMPH